MNYRVYKLPDKGCNGNDKRQLEEGMGKLVLQ